MKDEFMIPILSLVTSVKDYLEVVHKLIEYDSLNINYNEFGTIFTYFLISVKTCLGDFFSLSWLKNIWSLPVIMPEISSAMISEISVLDGYFHNAFNFLETPVSYGEQNGLLYGLEKFTIGLLNSLFLFLPTSTAHIITLRRFVMQGLEAGYVSGLGTIAGNLLWLASVIFGWRFFVIPWLSLDIFRYLLGFVLLIKYMWDSYNEQKLGSSGNATLDNGSKQKIFLLNFLLVLTEQTSIYPFISNFSISPETSILESFPVDSYSQFIFIHFAYLLGITVGCFSLLHFTCWFWENPAFKIYMWVISSFKVSTSFYYKALNFTFLYLTMISAISSIPYYGLDYTITNPLGYVNDDRIIQDKLILETSFLGSKASDRNTRRNRGRHGRRERWKRRIRKYRTFDASLYDQGIYDLFTIEDLNYGFDRFWLRRKLRNHRVRFRFFPGPWMRTFKKQLAKPRLESYTGPRSEFFRILFEQVYHPSFHAYESKQKPKNQRISDGSKGTDSGVLVGTGSIFVGDSKNLMTQNFLSQPFSIYSRLDSKHRLVLNELSTNSTVTSLNNGSNNPYKVTDNLKSENSTLRKFVRKLDTRLKMAELSVGSSQSMKNSVNNVESSQIYSKQWKHLFSKMYHNTLTGNDTVSSLKDSSNFNKSIHRTFANNAFNFISGNTVTVNELSSLDNQQMQSSVRISDLSESAKKQTARRSLSNKDLQILRYRSLLTNANETKTQNDPQLLLHPLKFYLQREAAFKRKLRYYSPSVFRKFSVENNAPYFRVMMRRYFYNYKPSLRWERTMKVASLRKARRKTTRIPRKLQMTGSTSVSSLAQTNENSLNMLGGSYLQNATVQNSSTFEGPVNTNVLIASKRLQNPTYNYSVVSKKASRYRYQIYKDVLQHMYYSPFNRLLLKLDVDSFIRRQPNTHFLTQKEENLLHLRRFLISEHYNTLRWYTNMEHYRSMKTRLNGGSKSFSSRAYNQQFAGTFKKIRHLFAITPSQGQDNVILKFDQPLYNEVKNTSANPLLNQVIIHEELLPFDYKTTTTNNGDLLNSSQNIVRTYLNESRTARDEYIKQLLAEKNYTKLTQFLYKGQKLRGTEAVTNQRLLNLQEKEALLTSNEKRDINEQLKSLKLRKFIMDNNLLEDLYVTYLKNWKRKMNDQEALKNYLNHRVEKREKRKQKKEKNLLNKLKRLENWVLPSVKQNGPKEQENTAKLQSTSGNNWSQNDLLTTGFQKAIFEGMATLKDIDVNVQKPSEKTVWKVLLLSSIKEKTKSTVSSYKDLPIRFNELKVTQQNATLKSIKASTTQLKTLVEVMNKNNKKSNITKKAALQMQTTVSNVYTQFKKAFNSYLGIENITNLFKPIKRKSLKNWRKKERASGRQKRSRKEFKLLNKKVESKDLTGNLISDRNEIELALQQSLAVGAMDGRKKRQETNETQNLSANFSFTNNLENTSFKRKRSPQRRARVRRSRGVFKKRTLSDSLKKDIKLFVKTKDQLSLDDKTSFFDKMNTNLYSITSSGAREAKQPKDTDSTVPLKQRKSKQRKQRYWKQKRSKYSQKRRKYRKRKRYALGKIRILSKQLKRVKNKIEIQNWWWKQFVPSIQASTDALWQIEKDKLIQQKLSELSSAEILERDQLFNSSKLQIGNKDFKPLAMPEAMRLKDKALSTQTFGSPGADQKSYSAGVLPTFESENKTSGFEQSPSSNFDVVNKLYENLFTSGNIQNEGKNAGLQSSSFMTPNTMLPFYAGWDESLRKFVVTNRMLSRRDAGFEMAQTNNSTLVPSLKPLLNTDIPSTTPTPSVSFGGVDKENSLVNIEFSQAPVQGMNAATTLYWQIPFTTYDPDQFFALGMDGFSPIGWRKFLFRHSILKTWLKTVTEAKTSANSTMNNDSQTFNGTGSLVITSKTSLVNTLKEKSTTSLFKRSERTFDAKNATRRLKKRYRRVKKHPRTPVWFPSGPLLNQVLPVHYIYVFYKRSRLPRDRYLKRRLLNTKTINKSEGLKTLRNFEGSPYLTYDFTLRKRLKPKRKYHLKRDFYASNVVIPRRFKFITSTNNNDILTTSPNLRWRPLSSLKINKPIIELVKEQKLLRSKQRRKDPSSKQQQTPLLRVKQLRRRVQRQILRSVWRYRPRAGGFVWPGDYLKLELVKAPKLQAPDLQTQTENKALPQSGTASLRGKKKKKRTLVEWQIQPKKYLYEKHNIKVLKKKLEKAFRSDSMQQKIKEINYKL